MLALGNMDLNVSCRLFENISGAASESVFMCKPDWVFCEGLLALLFRAGVVDVLLLTEEAVELELELVGELDTGELNTTLVLVVVLNPGGAAIDAFDPALLLLPLPLALALPPLLVEADCCLWRSSLFR